MKTGRAAWGELKKEREELGETNDCSVVALTHGTGLDYRQVHAAMKKAGRRNRRGAYLHQVEAAARSLGFELKDVSADVLPPFRRVTVNRIPAYLDRTKNYFVHVRKHFLCVKEGKVADWTEGRRHQVRRVYEIVKKDAKPAPQPKPAPAPAAKKQSTKMVIFKLYTHAKAMGENPREKAEQWLASMEAAGRSVKLASVKAWISMWDNGKGFPSR